MWGAILHTIYAIVSLTDWRRTMAMWRRLLPATALTKAMPNFEESAIATRIFLTCRQQLGIQYVAWVLVGTALAIPPKDAAMAILLWRSEAKFSCRHGRRVLWRRQNTLACEMGMKETKKRSSNLPSGSCQIYEKNLNIYIGFIHRWFTNSWDHILKNNIFH